VARAVSAITAAAVAAVIAAAEPLAAPGSGAASVSNHSDTVNSRNGRATGRF
jgi:hypothetical protein